jgi:hypothetical protein
MFLVSAMAMLAILVVLGTDPLGRPLTDEEKKRFGNLLREHDYPGARLVALRFALKLARSRLRAQDLMGRADLRLVRQGWDPSKVTLVRCLCRLVWSEWTHAEGESETARKAEEGFLRELEVTEGLVVPSIEQRMAAEAKRREAQAKLAKLRAFFQAAGDEVNLLWLDRSLDEEPDLQKMAKETGRDATEFYAAAKRRKRAVQRLLAEERGVPFEEDT